MNFKKCSKCEHKDTDHIMGGLCVHEECGCTSFKSGVSKVDPTRDQLGEILELVCLLEEIHEEGFALEERINAQVNTSAKLHGWS